MKDEEAKAQVVNDPNTGVDVTYEVRNAFSVIQRELADMAEARAASDDRAEVDIIERKQGVLAELREFVLAERE